MKHDVVRFDTPEDTGVPGASLIESIAEPPLGGEAVVLDARGQTLAMAIEAGRREDGRRIWSWAVTGAGCPRIEAEANGLRVAS